MIRKFIQCKSVKERLEFMLSTTMNDWEEAELTTVMQIIGLTVSKETSKEGKWAIILNNLLLKEYANEKEISASDKIFHDAKERLAEIRNIDELSDFMAYMAVCKQQDIPA